MGVSCMMLRHSATNVNVNIYIFGDVEMMDFINAVKRKSLAVALVHGVLNVRETNRSDPVSGTVKDTVNN